MVKRLKVLLAVVMSVALIASSSFCVLAEEDFDPALYDYNVMLNGDYVEFSDAAPVNVEGRIMVPFRVILETLGATVSWDDPTRTVTAVLDDTTITFVVGQPNINIDKAGEKSVKKMDVVPYINPANNRTYVSTRFVAESFGFNVGWDSEMATAIIIDYDTIFGSAAEDFTEMDAFMQSTKVDMNATYESLISAVVEISIYKEMINSLVGETLFNKDLSLEIAVDGEAITKGDEVSLDMGMSMNLDELLSALPADAVGELTAEDKAILDTLSDMEISAYAEMESGEMCFTTNMNSMIDPSLGDDVWFKMNLYDIYESIGLDLGAMMDSALTAEITSMEDTLDFIAEMSEETMTIYTYDEMVTVYDLLKAMIGDDVLKVSKSGAATTYTADLSGIGDYIGYDGIKGKLVMTDRQNGNYDCVMEIVMDIEGLGEISMSIDASYDKTDKAVEKVPAGAQVVDISSAITDVL